MMLVNKIKCTNLAVVLALSIRNQRLSFPTKATRYSKETADYIEVFI